MMNWKTQSKPQFQEIQNSWRYLGISQKFLLFFLLTAILPILVFSGLFFHTVDTKFDERISNLLTSGVLFAKELFRDELHKEDLIAKQAVFLSINEKYHYYLKTGRYMPLEEMLNLYQKEKKLDILLLIDNQGHVVASTKLPKSMNQQSIQAMVHSALSGRGVSAIQSFQAVNGTYQLSYISVVPVYEKSNSRFVLGCLLTGKTIDQESSLTHLPRILHGLEAQVYVKSPEGYHLALSTIPGEEKEDSPDFLNAVDTAPPASRDKALQQTFIHSIGDADYKSRLIQLRDFLGNTIGYIVISTSQKDQAELKRQNYIYLALFLLCGLVIVSLVGAWFKRSIINPINALSEASKKVASGDLNAGIPALTSQDEMAITLDSFNKMLIQLQENERLRSTFVSTLTHDLRTPLIAQKRVLEIFEAEFSSQQDKGLTSLATGLLKSNDNLLEMVNKLLESYQYEEGKINLTSEMFNIQTLIADCFAEVSMMAASKGITLEHVIPDEPIMVYGDFSQLKRVILNLVGNALDNITSGCWIRIEVEEMSEACLIKVQDNGPGIEPEILPNLFERYFTGNRVRKKIGSGLGLYICRMIIGLHGGTIRVESQLGEGSIFYIELPGRTLEQEGSDDDRCVESIG